jgi:hypothetical protein
MSSRGVIRFGGLSLLVGALAFLAVFSYLAARFNYPDVLDGSAADVLPALLATGSSGRAAWAIYGFLPLIWIPAGVGAFHALRAEREGTMRVAMHFASLSAIAMMLGLLRWPSAHWVLAETFGEAGPETRFLIAAEFDALNSYLGNYVGEFLGELSFSVFFLLSALAMLAPRSRFPRWMAILGLLTACAGFVGMFRNVTDVVDPVAEVNNYLLPLWMMVFGIGMLRSLPAEPEAASPAPARSA